MNIELCIKWKKRSVSFHSCTAHKAKFVIMIAKSCNETRFRLFLGRTVLLSKVTSHGSVLQATWWRAGWYFQILISLGNGFHGINNISYVQTVPNHRRLLIIEDKSLPHKQRWASTWLLIFKIRFSSEPPSRWLAGSAEITPVIGNARRVRGEVTLTIKLVD